MNKAILIGRIGKDVDVRTTASGVMVATTSLATSKKVKGEERTTWHNLVFWDKRAEFASKHLNKGDAIAIEGEIENRSYEDRDGVKKYISEIIVFQSHFLPGGSRQGQQQESRSQRQQEPQSGGFDNNQFNPDDGIPFKTLPHWREGF